MSMLRNRREIAKHLNELGLKVGAEVGVYDGYYSEILCEEIPGLKLSCVDSWKSYPGYGDFQNQKRLNAAMERAKERLASYDATLIQKFSVEAAKDFEDGSLDFVYIDANHGYGHVLEDLVAWVPKVRKGGIVAGDDYYLMRSGNIGVIKAVHEYVGKHGYELQITPWDLTSEKADDQQPQWWFVK